MSSSLLSVIIPTYHRNDDLALCLNCLAPGVQSLPPDAYEVIVTDDGSESTAEKMIRDRYPWAKWTEGPRRGPAANRNHGARQAQGEWLVFTDDDCLPSQGWLGAFWEAREQASVLEGLTRADRERRSYAEEAPINLTGGYLWSCNFAVKKRVFDAVGRFDENFPAPAMEDCDFRETLREAGYGFPFLPEAEVIHPWRPERSWRFWEKHQLSYLYFIKKHPGLAPKYPAWSCFTYGIRTLRVSLFSGARRHTGTEIGHYSLKFIWHCWSSVLLAVGLR